MPPECDPFYSERLDQALDLAAKAFRRVPRKGTKIPYLSHLLAVTVTVAEHGGDEDQLIAAVLHDYLEDIEGATAAGLEAQFGSRVARLVAGLSDTDVRPKPAWLERKRKYLAHLHTAAHDLKLISAADKLHNARCIRRDLGVSGNAVWERFSATREQTLWYYREVVDALGDGWSSPVLDDLRAEVDALHAAAEALAQE